jgi:membrane-associated phospholipid phosphatase
LNGWALLTSLGDTNVTLAAAIVLVIWLVVSGAKSLALWWSALFGVLLAIVVASKLIFLGWGIGISDLDFTGISGHSSRTAAVIPVMFYVFFGDARPAWRTGLVTFSYLLAAAIATSRVMIGAHSVSEALAGFILGAVISALFIRQAHGQPRRRPGSVLIGASTAIILATLMLGPAPTKAWMRDAATYLSGKVKPFQRGDLPPRSGAS